jgi:hypothetical protein
MMQILQEYLAPPVANLCEMSRQGGDMFLSGIMMQSEIRNGNNRVYSLNEISRVVKECQEKLNRKEYIMGELNHPPTLSINLANVSHIITEMHMRGNDACGKMKLLDTPSGNIVKALIKGGVRPGVSSRGSGAVNESGNVTGFTFLTMDIVANPSAPNAYPDIVTEALSAKKIETLAEAVVNDKKAQQYLEKEICLFINKIMKVK